MTRIHTNRQSASMFARNKFLRVAALGLVATVGLTACGSDDNGGGVTAGGKAYIRYLNGTWQEQLVTIRSAGPSGPVDTVYSYKPISIDVLVDSSGSAPGVTGLAANSLSNGPTGPNGNAAGFFELEPGVHSYVARRGDIANGPSFFVTPTGSNCAPAQYLPRQQMTGTTFYTLVVAGVNPRRTTNTAGDSLNTLAAKVTTNTSGCSFSTIFSPNSLSSVEDPFSPPWTSATGSNVYQARFFFWHAAPFLGTGRPIVTSPASARVYITPGADPAPTTVTTLQYWDQISFQSKGQPQNIAAGEYWITIAEGTTNNILYQAKFTFAAGEVRSFFIMKKLPPSQTAMTFTPGGTSSVVIGGSISKNADGVTDIKDQFQLLTIKNNQFSF